MKIKDQIINAAVEKILQNCDVTISADNVKVHVNCSKNEVSASDDIDTDGKPEKEEPEEKEDLIKTIGQITMALAVPLGVLGMFIL